jgi:hypothetical protein
MERTMAPQRGFPRPIAEMRIPEFTPARHRKQLAGFEHLANLDANELQTQLKAAEAKATILRGSSGAKGLPTTEVNRLKSLPDESRPLALVEIGVEATALRNELRRRLAFRP